MTTLEQPVTLAPLAPSPAPTRAAALATARLHALLDVATPLTEVPGVVVMSGSISGTPVIAFATDPTAQGGALGVDGCRAIAEATHLAVRQGIPVVGVWHSGGPACARASLPSTRSRSCSRRRPARAVEYRSCPWCSARPQAGPPTARR